MTRTRVMTAAGLALVAVGVLLLVSLVLRGGEDAEEVADDGAGRVASEGGAPPSAAPYGGLERETEEDAAPAVPAEERVVSAPRPAPRQVVFCFPGVIPDECASRAVVASYADEPVGVLQPGGEAVPLTVTLADPDDAGAPTEEAATCDAFLRLKSRGWGPLTSAAIARELEMIRFCGLVRMASRAEPAVRPGLSALGVEALRAVTPGDWPALGELEAEDPALSYDEAAGRWVAEAAALTITLREVASADFDGDGAAEVLTYATVRPTGATRPGATMRGGGYLLAERDGGAGPVRLTPADLY